MSKKGLSEEKITKSKKRIKDKGEVYTPKRLVNEILDKLPKNIWSEKDKTFFDPACGNGNFLVEVVERKIKAGSTKWQALSTTFGVDIMDDNVKECRQRLLQIADVKQKRFIRLLEHTIVCGDTLKQPLDIIFESYEKTYKTKI